MKLKGETRFDALPQQVWDVLLDPDPQSGALEEEAFELPVAFDPAEKPAVGDDLAGLEAELEDIGKKDDLPRVQGA